MIPPLLNNLGIDSALPTDTDESVENDFTDFNKCKVIYQKLIGDWDSVVTDTNRNRLVRYVEVDNDRLRSEGKLQVDEIYNPIRIIDTNIRREQPKYVKYLVGSRRAAIFTSTEEADIERPDGIEKLEAFFTKVCRYKGWTTPHIQVIDGGQTHGWDYVEIEFDTTKPGHFGFTHVGRANLIFSNCSEDIQSQEVVLKCEELTSSQLKSFVRNNGWNKEQVNKAIGGAEHKGETGEEVMVKVYKCFYKVKDIVYVSYINMACDDYLVPVKELFLGIRDVTKPKELMNAAQMEADPTVTPFYDYPKKLETKFPFFLFKYVESEDHVITNQRGRVKLDESVQEGASALSSALINGSVRASYIFGSPQRTDLNRYPNAAPKQLDIVIKPGLIFDQPMDWGHLPWPDPNLIKGIQGIVSQNQSEQSTPDWAVTNRKDSGKTATEIEAATNQSAELSSIQIINVADYYLECCTKAWEILQSRVLQDAIKVSPALKPMFATFQYQTTINPMTGQQEPVIDPTTNQPVVISIIPKEYLVKPAGDVDVIQRQESLQRFMQAWPVVQTQPAIAQSFFKDYLRHAFPNEAERYITEIDNFAMNQTNMLKDTLIKVSGVLKALVENPAVIATMSPEEQSKMQQLQTVVMQALGADNGGSAPSASNGPKPKPNQQIVI